MPQPLALHGMCFWVAPSEQCQKLPAGWPAPFTFGHIAGTASDMLDFMDLYMIILVIYSKSIQLYSLVCHNLQTKIIRISDNQSSKVLITCEQFKNPIIKLLTGNQNKVTTQNSNSIDNVSRDDGSI
jgi:hypothetical protein